jgi:hypothetical protein
MALALFRIGLNLYYVTLGVLKNTWMWVCGPNVERNMTVAEVISAAETLCES